MKHHDIAQYSLNSVNAEYTSNDTFWRTQEVIDNRVHKTLLSPLGGYLDTTHSSSKNPHLYILLTDDDTQQREDSDQKKEGEKYPVESLHISSSSLGIREYHVLIHLARNCKNGDDPDSKSID